MNPTQALRFCRELIQTGVKPETIIVDESAPDHLVQLQAEVMNSERYLEIIYAVRSGVGMRQAYPIMDADYGLNALGILKHFLDASSYDCLMDLLERYHDSVFEIASYSIPVGRLGWNTLIWEVRNY